MGETLENKPKKHICLGILAHVDAGKTTLSEAMLYISGAIRKPGRVDNRDAFLDTNELERARGITIFSKQAEITLDMTQITLVDTPGHVDFSAEMERSLQIMDYAVLVINGADGVQGHTETLWRLLERWQIPVFLFINKMDQEGTDEAFLMEDVRKRLSGSCVRFHPQTDREQFLEELALCREELLEAYLEQGTVSEEAVRRAIRERKVFPCYFGSALKLTGVEELLAGLERYMEEPTYPAEFGAKVYKIARDEQGNRLTYLKVTGGSLLVKALVSNQKEGMPKEEIWEEKIDQIRLYSGARYQLLGEAKAGTLCAVTGLGHTFPGQGLGRQEDAPLPLLEPVLTYRIGLPEGTDVPAMYAKLRQLEEEEPQLHIVWNEALGELHAQLMGEVQTEVLRSMIRERFGTDVAFDTGRVLYKETILSPAEGVGHFEPLRHYAEVHLWLEPGEPGSGLQFGADCSEDVLDRSWQRLVLTHLEETEHPGVLTGSPLTDMKITLIGGRAHLKHTEGGDFRQATYRAVRQGLRMTESRLLEPWYAFRLEVPQEMIGRAMSDIQKRKGRFDPPQMEGEQAVLTGSAPVVSLRDYQKEVISYSRGKGRLNCFLKGYEPCHNEEEVIAAIGYDADRDPEHPADSVFCAHGAGFVVPWYQVRDYMHVRVEREPKGDGTDWEEEAGELAGQARIRAASDWSKGVIGQEEIDEIMHRTYAANSQPRSGWKKTRASAAKKPQNSTAGQNRSAPDASPRVLGSREEEYLLVDGYNIIFAWEELRRLAQVTIDGARDKLMDILCDYQGIRRCHLILVFDAYKVEGNPGSVQKYHNIHVVYTKEAETADQYIEKTVHSIARKHRVSVATSDGLEQVIILGQGAVRLSAKDLKAEVERAKTELRQTWLEPEKGGKNRLLDHADAALSAYLEAVRLGKTEETGPL